MPTKVRKLKKVGFTSPPTKSRHGVWPHRRLNPVIIIVNLDGAEGKPLPGPMATQVA